MNEAPASISKPSAQISEPSAQISKPSARWTRSRAVTILCLVLAAILALYRIAPYLPRAPISEDVRRPTSADWDRAMSGLNQGETPLAEDYIERSLGNSSLQAQRSLLQGRLFLQRGNLIAAAQAFSEAQADTKLGPLATYWQGATRYAMGDQSSAESLWQEAAAADPEHTDTQRSLAMLYYDRGATDHAVHHLRQVARLAPGDARPYRLLGLMHKDYEQYDQAVQLYQQALTRGLTAETRQQVLTELAQSQVKIRNYEAALKTLEPAIANATNRTLQAECLVGLGRSDEAAHILDTILGAEPKAFDALVARAGIHIEAQNAAKAIELLDVAVTLKPTDYLANFRLSQAWRIQGDADKGNQYAVKAEELKALRERFSKLHQDATARPDDAEVRYELGEVALQLQMPDLARNWFQVALQLNPQLSKAKEKLDSLTPK